MPPNWWMATSTVDVGDSFSMDAGNGESRIGHRSSDTDPGANYAQIGVSNQQLTGDITVKVGTAKDGVADGAVVGDGNAADNDDALIKAGNGGIAAIGHDMANNSNNEVQIAKGDIWLEVGADLHVDGGRIGHDDYDFASGAVSKDNSYDLAVAKAAAQAAGSGTDVTTGKGVGTIRNRIQGNTTIGAAQNTPTEDSTLVPDVMKFDGSTNAVKINSGYGGIADKDVDGELRFFIPSQENLTVTPAVTFNDSVSSGTDAVPTRVSNAGNVFTAEAGLDHEHNFALMADTTPYLR